MKRNQIKFYIKTIVVLGVLFFLTLLVKALRWLPVNFGDVEFSTVVYQLLSPLKGTGQGMVEKFVRENIPGAVLWTIALFVVLTVNRIVSKRVNIKWNVQIGRRAVQLTYHRQLVSGFLTICLLGVLFVQARSVGAVDYVKELSQTSTIYDDYYVKPTGDHIHFSQKKRNLIFIYMESMEATFASHEVGGGKPINYIPLLTQMADENVNFSNNDHIGGALQAQSTEWTIAGLMASSTGVNYKFPITRENAEGVETIWPGLVSIGDILKDNGYHNYYMCGSDASFAGKRMFLEGHGDFTIYDHPLAQQEGVIAPDYAVNWGFEDKILYAWAKEKITEAAAKDEPFNFTILTSDTHFSDGYVCDLCEEEYPEQYGNVIRCADRQIDAFVNWAKTQDWYDNTTIVIMGDHISMNETFYDDIGDYERTVFNCFVNAAPELNGKTSKNRLFTTMDIFPTTIAALGASIDGNRLGLGTNLFSGDQTLSEQLGFDYFNDEIGKTSYYYLSQFVY